MSIAGIALAIAGTYVSLREGRVYLAQGSNSVLRIAAMTSADLPPALSYEGQRNTLTDCELLARSMDSLQMRYLDPATPPLLLDKCRTMAEDIVSAAPTDSFGWLVAAAAAAEQGDMVSAIPAYMTSVQTGRNEQWIAQNRVSFAETYLADLPADALLLHEGDLRMLAQSPKGIVFLARQYVRSPEFRPRMTAILESVPATYQRNFLYNVRVQMSGGDVP